MLKEPRERTGKVFEEYNDYHDRGSSGRTTSISAQNGLISQVMYVFEENLRYGVQGNLHAQNQFFESFYHFNTIPYPIKRAYTLNQEGDIICWNISRR